MTTKPTPPKAIATAKAPTPPTAIKNDGAVNPADVGGKEAVTSDASTLSSGVMTDAEKALIVKNDGTPVETKADKKLAKAVKGTEYTNHGKGLFVIGSTEFLPGVPTTVTSEMLEDEDFKIRLNYAAKNGSLTKGE